MSESTIAPPRGRLLARNSASASADREASYWQATRRPLASLFLVGPLACLHELGITYLTPAVRGTSGADLWMRQFLESLGFHDRGVLPLLLIVVLLIWHAFKPRGGVPPRSLVPGMLVESLVWAVLLIAASRAYDRAFASFEQVWTPMAAASPGGLASSGSMLEFLGAGIYEETLFRLFLVPAFYQLLRLCATPRPVASALAVAAAGFLFALAHHLGSAAELFDWFPFVFRWTAGIYFAWLFILRGFGIAVGAHAGYDILVGGFFS